MGYNHSKEEKKIKEEWKKKELLYRQNGMTDEQIKRGSCKTFFEGRVEHVDHVDLDAGMFQMAHGVA